LNNALSNAGANFISSAIYTWNPTKATVGAFVAVPNAKFATAKLPLGGAFVAMVVPGTSANFDFNEIDKTTTAVTTASFRPEEGEEVLPEIVLPTGLQLTLDHNNNNYDGLYVYFNTAARTSMERNLDAPKIGNPGADFYTRSTDGNKLSVDIRPFEAGKKVLLGLNKAEKGNYTIGVADWNLPQGTELYLVDTYTGKETLLNGASVYGFSVDGASGSQGDSRFYLRMGKSTIANVSSVSVDLLPNPATEMVTIRLHASEEGKASVRVLSITGQQMIAQEMESSQHSQLVLPLNNLAAGVYMVEVTVNGQKITKQLVKQ
jgi:hypothetical protein